MLLPLLSAVGIIATIGVGPVQLSNRMPTVQKISIALPAEMIAFLRAAVESGEYSSTSEIIREALRGWKFKRKVESLELDELRQLALEGIESGSDVDADIVFARLKSKYTALSKIDKTSKK